MSQTDVPPTFVHYRVKRGGSHWLHAVAMGDAAAVLKRLKEDDPVWNEASVELVKQAPIDEWNGPFPKTGRLKIWTVEADD